jgi:uracil-DNA glycosylase
VPQKNQIFKAFECDPNQVVVVIFGQDPYPNAHHAMGLAFSVNEDVKKLPSSLRNIFTELRSDIGFREIQNGDLSYLSQQGVMLLNRGLTLDLNSKKIHPLWYEFTVIVAQVLAKKGVVGIFWGKQAQELAEYFPENRRVLGVHPSPLSAYRGFFGSKPFSRTNEILKAENKKQIVWTKQ